MEQPVVRSADEIIEAIRERINDSSILLKQMDDTGEYSEESMRQVNDNHSFVQALLWVLKR